MRAPKIVYFINGFNRGGAENGLLHLIRRNVWPGAEVTVVSIVRGQGSIIAELAALGVDVVTFNETEGMSMGQWLASMLRMAALMRRIRPDLVILSLPQANIAGRVASLFARPRILASFEHNTHLAKTMYERLFRLLSFRVDWLIADAAATALEAERRLYRHPPKRRFVLPLVSFAEDAIATARPEREEGAPLRIVTAGRFTRVKNQESMIRALAEAKRQGHRFKLFLYGEGELKAHCAAVAREAGVEDQVVFSGFSRDWMKAEGDLFLIASHHEGLCIVALEAMSQGFPVVAPHVGGFNDYGEAAGVFFLHDVAPETIADALIALERDPLRLRAMSQKSIAYVTKAYSDSATDAVYEDFYAAVKAAAESL